MKTTVELINWKFHKGEIKLWDIPDHNACYNATKAGRMLGNGLSYIENNDWQDVTVPHDFCILDKADPEKGAESNGYKVRGVGWYYTSFDLPDGIDGDVWLEFEGVASRADVYVNGSIVTRHYSSYTGFFAEISDFLYSTDNIIAVRADNLRLEGWWYEGAGIYRPARLHFTSGAYFMPMETHIKQTSRGDKWSVDADVKVIGTSEYTVSARLSDADGNIIYEGNLPFDVDTPKLWSPDLPYLYSLELSLICGGEICGREEHRIGFRTVKWRTDGGMFINGKRTFVKGICNHQDHAGVGWAVPALLIRYRLEKLKKMGCNAYRCAHHNVSAEFLSICDELGIMVMNENRNFVSNEETLDEIRYMVKNSRNHPSVFLYSLLNEEPLQKEAVGKRIADRLKAAILELDTDRAITGAINGAENIEGKSAADTVDVMGMNYSIFAYEKLYERQKKVILGTENGPVYATRGVYASDKTAQIYGSYGDELTAFGQSYEDTLRAVKAHDYIAGVFLWSGFDYHGEPQPFTWPSVVSHWGMCDICGFEKDIYYHVMSFYSDEPMIHVLPIWQDFEEGEPVRVATFTNCPKVRLYIGGDMIGEADVTDNRAEFTVPYKKGTLTAEGIGDGISVSDSVSSAGEFSSLDCKVRTDGRYKIIDITAVDERFVHVNAVSDTVSVSVSGGRVIGCGNGDPNAPLDCCADTVPMFHGKCQFIIEGIDGDAAVTVTSSVGVFNL